MNEVEQETAQENAGDDIESVSINSLQFNKITVLTYKLKHLQAKII